MFRILQHSLRRYFVYKSSLPVLKNNPDDLYMDVVFPVFIRKGVLRILEFRRNGKNKTFGMLYRC